MVVRHDCFHSSEKISTTTMNYFFVLSETCHTAHHITALCIILVLLSCTPSGEKRKKVIPTCSTTRSIELATLRNRFIFPTMCPVGPTFEHLHPFVDTNGKAGMCTVLSWELLCHRALRDSGDIVWSMDLLLEAKHDITTIFHKELRQRLVEGEIVETDAY